jgi:4-amino-4-deoxy-L-arabinose transferase-like glycosyltransferase
MWDERFHALVAKNMLENPFIPMLYTENPVEIDNSFWSMGHIWLHKQPLFLWQIALSFKIFGINEIALRLPNIIMCSLLIYPLFQLGRILVNERTGFMTSFLFITSFYFGELVAGWQLLDHNDIAFLFYTTLSIWAWVEYTEREKKSWILLAGLFSGLAILNKWLVGLLVFAGWITMILTNKNLRSN